VADQPVIDETLFPGFPPFPEEGTEVSSLNKGVSWLYSADPTTPILEHRTALCPLHPNCLKLEGLPYMPLTHVPPPPYYAYAFYEIPIGANGPDLEKLHLSGAVESAGDKYYMALANYDAMAWEWFGPATGEFTVDFAPIGYNFTSPLGRMYIAVVVPAFDALHLWGIQLNFKDTAGGPLWNAWGKAYDAYIPGAPATVLPGETVTFEDTLTGVTYNTTTGADGGWGLNLPDGYYKFNVTNSQFLFDLGGFMPIETLPVTLEMNTGQMYYHGTNAVYSGSVLPMPVITLNVF
jgi:hypothetical protein